MKALNKRLYQKGLTCPLSMWHEARAAENETFHSLSERMRLKEGQQVNELARREFPGGVLVACDFWQEGLRETRRWLVPREPPVFEACFESSGMRAKTDVLVPIAAGGWDLIEVKSGCTPTAYFTDVAFQLHLLRLCGVQVNRAWVMCLDPQRVYGDPTLFQRADVTDAVEPLTAEIAQHAPRLCAFLHSPTPPSPCWGRPCRGCYQAPECFEGIVHPTFELLNGAKKIDRLFALGVFDLQKLSDQVPLTPNQQRQVNCIVSGRRWESGQAGSAINGLAYPIHFLDFETAAPAIPRFPGQHPYDCLAFQWSCHIQRVPGQEPGTPLFSARRARGSTAGFTESLLTSLENSGTILVFSAYEQTTLDNLQEVFPDLASTLESVKARLVDLLPVVRRHIFDAQFHGSFSLKRVAPVLVPEFTYEGLSIAEGLEASAAYLELMDEGCPPERQREIRGDLEAYCARDTLVLAAVLDRIRQMEADDGCA